ncbi:hypothetical protein LTR85_002529 [Meristemomyces frigidus]|nr:hypothetical protein LTR85_002529 [Meristemomyces frigidus]
MAKTPVPASLVTASRKHLETTLSRSRGFRIQKLKRSVFSRATSGPAKRPKPRPRAPEHRSSAETVLAGSYPPFTPPDQDIADGSSPRTTASSTHVAGTAGSRGPLEAHAATVVGAVPEKGSRYQAADEQSIPSITEHASVQDGAANITLDAKLSHQLAIFAHAHQLLQEQSQEVARLQAASMGTLEMWAHSTTPEQQAVLITRKAENDFELCETNAKLAHGFSMYGLLAEQVAWMARSWLDQTVATEHQQYVNIDALRHHLFTLPVFTPMPQLIPPVQASLMAQRAPFLGLHDAETPLGERLSLRHDQTAKMRSCQQYKDDNDQLAVEADFGDSTRSNGVDQQVLQGGYPEPSARGDEQAASEAQVAAAYDAARLEADTRRGNAHAEYLAARDAWQKWRDDYQHLLLHHQSGVDPGFEADGWDSTWTQEDFDVQHLLRARRLTTRTLKRERKLLKTLELGKIVNLEPLAWQDSDFPDHSHYYTESQENDRVESAPKASIVGWLSKLPNAPGGFAGQEIVEYPEGMDYSGSGEVELWESESCVPDKYTKQRIRETQPAEPPLFAQPQESSAERVWQPTQKSLLLGSCQGSFHRLLVSPFLT